MHFKNLANITPRIALSFQFIYWNLRCIGFWEFRVEGRSLEFGYDFLFFPLVFLSPGLLLSGDNGRRVQGAHVTEKAFAA